MKFATFTTQVNADKSVEIPPEVLERLRLLSGDKVEVSLKRIKSKRLDLFLAENPLYRLLDMSMASGDEGGL